MDITVMAYRLETKRQWLSGLAITLTSLVCLFGFWRLSPVTTFVIASTALVALVGFFWMAGKGSKCAS
jgi:hypothetical protein